MATDDTSKPKQDPVDIMLQRIAAKFSTSPEGLLLLLQAAMKPTEMFGKIDQWAASPAADEALNRIMAWAKTHKPELLERWQESRDKIAAAQPGRIISDAQQNAFVKNANRSLN